MLNKVTMHDLSSDAMYYDYFDMDMVVTRNVELFSHENTPLLNRVYLFICCLNGHGILTMNRRLYAFKSNDICICGPTSKINISFLTECPECCIVALKPSYINRLLRRNQNNLRMSDFDYNPICRLSNENEINLNTMQYVNNIIDVVTRKSDYFKSEMVHNSVLSLMFSIFIYMKELEDMERDRRIIRAGTNDVVYKLFQNELDKSNGKFRSIKEYADLIGCSTSFLSACLVQKTGKDAYQFIEEATLEQAKLLLRCSSLSIKEICFHLNFPDKAFFSKFMKRHLGITPIEFRKLSSK